MYAAKAFREERLPVLHEFIRQYSFASVISNGREGMRASHVPLILDSSRSPQGHLIGHVARANPQWRAFAECDEVLVIFQGPQAYISPNWYPSKQEHGKVVPTWNYLAVHAYGSVRVFEDPASLRGMLEALTDQHEAAQPAPWSVSDLPEGYIDDAMRSIVGFEVSLSRIEGIWKMSQNRSDADRLGAAAGLMQGGEVEVAELIRCPGEDE
jgi:transcriptional regulator